MNTTGITIEHHSHYSESSHGHYSESSHGHHVQARESRGGVRSQEGQQL